MDAALTVEEACEILNPPVTPEQLRTLIRALGVQPSGTRRSGRRGRPFPTYDVGELLRLHEALVPFLPSVTHGN